MEPTIGELYQVSHRRRGVCQARIQGVERQLVALDGNDVGSYLWVGLQITEGTLRKLAHLGRYFSPGDQCEVLASEATFTRRL